LADLAVKGTGSIMGRVAVKLGSKLFVKCVGGRLKFIIVARYKVGVLVARAGVLQAEVPAAALAHAGENFVGAAPAVSNDTAAVDLTNFEFEVEVGEGRIVFAEEG
jgi:hypothetical protein